MRAKITHFLKNSVFFILCLAILIAAPALMFSDKSGNATAEKETKILSVWQIDCFEGGKGSRGAFLQSLGDKFSVNANCYINVVSLTAEAARMNLSRDIVPDLISYGAGIYGIENYIRGKTSYYTWCHGGYCLITTDTNSDFSEVSTENTVINGGTGNLVTAAAMLAGLSGATVDKPTGAYVKLINGDYKYLLGTQRDIFRMKTRGVPFTIKPLTEFNDLYQNISITARDHEKITEAEKFVSYILENADITKIGLMQGDKHLYDDEMSAMEGLEYSLKLISPVSENMHNELENAVANSDENKLKTLLK